MRKSPNVGVVFVCFGAGRLFHACGDNETNSDDTDWRSPRATVLYIAPTTR